MSEPDVKVHTPPPAIRAPELLKPPRIPDHELLRRIGRGSYGEVWLARSVTGAYRAVKIVHRQSFDHDRPFEREFSGILKFEPISRKHESQVDILHVGRSEDCFYYVMELADDQATAQQINPGSYAAKTLKSELFHRGKLPFQECVQISLALTTALDHLHTNGLVHRDVKPSNIIFINGVPKLADIGLVTGVDATRSFVGTEGFAPPEGPGTTQADIYSLGKVLYEICTGKDRQEFPELPTNLDALSDREGVLELNAVIAKACREDPRARYSSAKTMHDELQLLQSGKSLARLRTMERTVAKLKRASAAIAIVTVLATAAFLYQSHQTRVVKNLAAENLALAGKAQGSSKESQDRLVQMQIANAVRLMDQAEPMQSLLWLAEAFKNIEGDPAREEMHRIRIDSVLRNCPKLWRVIAHDASVEQAVFSPDGSRLATFSRKPDGSAFFTSVFDLGTGEKIVKLTHTNTVTGIAFSPDGRRLRIVGDSWNGLFDARTGENLMPANVEKVLAMSSDGELIFARLEERKGQVRVRNTGVALGDPIEPGHKIWHATFSKNNRRLIVGTGDGAEGFQPDLAEHHLNVYDVPTGRPIGKSITFPEPLSLSLSFSPDSSQIATSIKDWRKGWLPEVQLWNVADTSLVTVLKHDSGVADCNYSDDGRWLITTSDSMRVWDIKTGTAIGPPMKDGPCFSLSPDGLLLATGSDGAAAHVWNLFTGEPVVPALHSGMHVRCVAFSPDGRYLAVASTDKTVRIWDLAGLGRAERIFKLPASATYATFSPDGKQLLVTSPEEARVWDVGTGKAQSPPFDAGAQLWETRFTPDARLAVTCGSHQYQGLIADAMGVFVWNTATARLALPALLTHEFVTHAEFSPDGQRFVTASFEKYARVWNTRSGEPITPPLQHEGPLRYAAFSPDGRQVVTASNDRIAQLWDAATGARLLRPFKHDNEVNYATFNRDGTMVATASADQSVRVWNALTGEPITPALFRGGNTILAAFSPDGQSLLALGLGGHMPLWQLNKPDPLLAVLNNSGRGRAGSFSSDGKFILSAGGNGARLWDAASGEPVTDFFRHRKEVMHAEFRPNHDQQFVTASADKTVRLWSPHKWKYSAKTLTEFAELLSSVRLGRNGTLMPIEPEKLAALSDSLHSQCPELFETSASDVLAWHREIAELGAQHDQWRTVIWHLDKVLAAEPGDFESIRLRATAYAEMGQWAESRRDFETVLKSDQMDAQNWENLALNCLATDDLSDYRKLCADALGHFGHDPDPHSILHLAGLCSLIPDAISDYGSLLTLIHGALEQRPVNPLYVREHGAALYRAGQFEEAARELERSRALQLHEFTSSSGEKNVSPKTDRWEESFGMLFLGLADQRSRNSAPAQAAWQDARRLIEKWMPKKLSEDGPDWAARVRLNLLRREAEVFFKAESRLSDFR